ncbi:DUF4148 domain-containing protein [Paraburkholderia acidisoli]|uniref:DUF4148 domain-containing protein n=1 Tax=Paraburkholderia acidisoli TaxID=2571748 RepID=A0A7Z2JHP2_9BURK|nr:DUF4148 domain-containing protein [Paraburkholderia acidisoli]QGZ63594.1 DUF4148 domain-containing protein [Paraburkholderia acidisoli]
MKLLPLNAIALVALSAAFPVFAAPSLTPADCNAYPFTRAAGEVTHAQLEHELGELEQRGYRAGADASVYPADLKAAEQQLNADYRADCKRPAARS